ncbi:MAG: DUF2157 domain-containing protein [Candidatus Rokubacteria bacterium]|nr:DUF2157 domain-containing protein [Candidatus Rokubacteria bacterium]
MGDFPGRLATEAERWVRDGLLSADQARAIVARYPAGASWRNRPMAAFSLLGGALIAAAIALVIAHNWDGIHRLVKVGALVALMLAAHGGGLALRKRGGDRLGEGILLIGGALLMVGIALVGQIYNLHGRPSDAVLMWWVLLLPAAYTLPSVALIVLGYGAATTWYVMAAFDPTTMLGRASVPTVAYLPRSDAIPVEIGMFAIVLFAVGIAHGEGTYRRVRQMVEPVGLMLLFGALLWLTFGWHKPDRDIAAMPGLLSFVVRVLVTPTLIAVGVVARRLPHAQGRAGVVASLVLTVAFFVGEAAAHGVGNAPAVRGLALVSQALLLGLSIMLIVAGARWGRTSWINCGVVFVAIHAFARYVDLLGGMLQTSALFFSSGALLLVLGWFLERARRRLTADVTGRVKAV